MKPYPLQLEISGPTAIPLRSLSYGGQVWTRPDTGSSPVSYVATTFSAVKGIFESVLRTCCQPARTEVSISTFGNIGQFRPRTLRMGFDQTQSWLELQSK